MNSVMKHGFIRVAAAIPAVKVADVEFNIGQIGLQIVEAAQKRVEIVTFPELSVTGYSCQDLFMQHVLQKRAEAGVGHLLELTQDKDIVVIVGVPVQISSLLLNCAAVICRGQLLSLVAKTFLPNHGDFSEKRWFDSASELSCGTKIRYAEQEVGISGGQLFETADGLRFGVEIGADVWSVVPPSSRMALAGADLILNPSASHELIGKYDCLTSLLCQQSARTLSGYVYCGSGFGESTQDVVFGGQAMIAENGRRLAEAARFCLEPQLVVSEIDVELLRAERLRNTVFRDMQCMDNVEVIDLPRGLGQDDEADFSLAYRSITPHPFVPETKDMERSCEEVFNIQVAGLSKRLWHTHCKTVLIGISGGLDSTLALLVCVKTFDKLGLDRKGIIGVTMPGFGTTDRTYQNALTMMKCLGITMKEIEITKAVSQHFEDIGHDATLHDVTYENAQARERTQILMDLANRFAGMVIGTGDMSELALGWATYNGDHMSMYGVNAGVPKTLIRHLVKHVALNDADKSVKTVLMDIVDTPISPELTPANDDGSIQQKTEELVGPYELHDFFLFYVLRYGFGPSKIFMLAKSAFKDDYDEATIKKWLTTFFRRFFSQQFKRSCLPDGPKVGSVSLSPRGDWRMPSDASAVLWLAECEHL